MKLERLTLLRPNMGNYRSRDALPPLAMAILAARTPKDVAVTFYDDRVEEIPEDDCPDLVAISVETFTARRAYEIAAGYRRRNVPVVMGGYHPTLLPEEVLRHADVVVIGDAEGCWERLIEDFRKDRLRRVYRGGNDRPLDDLLLDRSIFAGKRYAPIEPVQYGRGCRFACDFCSIHAYYRHGLRQRPVEHVVREIEGLNRNRLLFFVDDNLFGSRDSLLRLLEAIEPLRRRWSCQISIDLARDDDLLDRMARAGCIFVLIGFESLSEDNLRQMGKGWNRVAGDYHDVVRKLHDRGMAVYGTFVFGYDGDTAETIDRTVEFGLRAKLDVANFNPLTPTPGTALYQRLEAEGRLLSPQWWLDPAFRYGDAILEPRSMPAHEFARKCFEARMRFYRRRSILARIVASFMPLNLFRTAIIALGNVVSREELMRKQYRALGD